MDQLSSVLPSNFALLKESEQLVLVVDLEHSSNESEVFYYVQRECDRLFFLTGEQLNPKLLRIEDAGKRHLFKNRGFITSGFERLQDDIDRQQWTHKLTLQLRLWQLAHLPDLPVSVQIVLLFQIIEAEFPDTKEYPPFYESDKVPHARTEAKLIRNWVSHQGEVRKQLLRYCKYLEIEPGFFDPTDVRHCRKIPMLLEKVKQEAEGIIDAAMTKKMT
ncbi:MAG TPA: hypothetical protein DDW27_06975 [Bacteroidales bacterium]|nr:hypothetical protein [Bacteroidales bacterium]